MAAPIAAAAAMAANQFTTDVNRYLDRRSNEQLMEKQQNYNKELMELQNQYTRRNFMDSPSMLVNGLRQAGLNPAAAAGSSMAAAGGSIGSTPSASGSSQYAKNFDIAAINQQLAATENLKAQTEKTQAETTKTNLENENTQGANAAVKDGMLNAIKMQKQVYEAYGLGTDRLDSLEKYLKDTDKVNIGTLAGLAKSVDVSNLLSREFTNKFEDLFEANFRAKQIDDDIAGVYNDMSKKARDLYVRKIALTYQQALLMASEAGLNKKHVEHLTQAIANLKQDIENAKKQNELTDVEIEHITNNDVNTLFENGRTGDAWRALGTSILPNLLGTAGNAFILRGIGKAGKANTVIKEGTKKTNKYKLYNSEGHPIFYEDSDDFNSILR